MARYAVTLKATLKRGTFYWTCAVTASSEEEALVMAENLFDAEMEHSADWRFDEYQVETTR
jgi:hypothetical protein